MGKFNGFNTGASNMQGLMRQAQRMQQEVARVQEEVGNTDFEASVGGGAVKVVPQLAGGDGFRSVGGEVGQPAPALLDSDAPLQQPLGKVLEADSHSEDGSDLPA